MYPKIILDLIEDLKRLPSIGEKTAERLALQLTSWEAQDLSAFGDHLKSLKSSIRFCTTCGLLSDHDTCSICASPLRDKKTIMVVENSKDVYAIEKTNSYLGNYHVLGGLVDFSRGVEPKDLNIENLIRRVPNINEIIIATNGTVEGELTAQYLKSLLKDHSVIVSRLGYGLPVGAELKYADTMTLIKAVENRQKY